MEASSNELARLGLSVDSDYGVHVDALRDANQARPGAVLEKEGVEVVLPPAVCAPLGQSVQPRRVRTPFFRVGFVSDRG